MDVWLSAFARWVIRSSIVLLGWYAAPAAASDLRSDLARVLPQGSGATTVPLLRFWGLVDDAFRVRTSLTVQSTLLAPGARNPARIVFLPDSASESASLALAVASVDYRRRVPAEDPKPCGNGAPFDACCTNAPYLDCFMNPALFIETERLLRQPFLMATAADVIGVDLSRHVLDVPVAGPFTQLREGQIYLALGYTPKSKATRFLAMSLDGKRMEALSHLLINIANRLTEGSAAESSYVCVKGSWQPSTVEGSSPFLLASGSPIDIRRRGDAYSHLLIGLDQGSLVVTLKKGNAAGQSTFFDLVSSERHRKALGECLGDTALLGNQTGLFNLLKDSDLSLFIGHALFLSGSWKSSGMLINLVAE